MKHTIEFTTDELMELWNIVYGFKTTHSITELRKEFWTLHDKLEEAKKNV